MILYHFIPLERVLGVKFSSMDETAFRHAMETIAAEGFGFSFDRLKISDPDNSLDEKSVWLTSNQNPGPTPSNSQPYCRIGVRLDRNCRLLVPFKNSPTYKAISQEARLEFLADVHPSVKVLSINTGVDE